MKLFPFLAEFAVFQKSGSFFVIFGDSKLEGAEVVGKKFIIITSIGFLIGLKEIIIFYLVYLLIFLFLFIFLNNFLHHFSEYGRIFLTIPLSCSG